MYALRFFQAFDAYLVRVLVVARDLILVSMKSMSMGRYTFIPLVFRGCGHPTVKRHVSEISQRCGHSDSDLR